MASAKDNQDIMERVAAGIYPANVAEGHINCGTLRAAIKGVDASTMVEFSLNDDGRTVITLTHPSTGNAVAFPADDA